MIEGSPFHLLNITAGVPTTNHAQLMAIKALADPDRVCADTAEGKTATFALEFKFMTSHNLSSPSSGTFGSAESTTKEYKGTAWSRIVGVAKWSVVKLFASAFARSSVAPVPL